MEIIVFPSLKKKQRQRFPFLVARTNRNYDHRDERANVTGGKDIKNLLISGKNVSATFCFDNAAQVTSQN